MRIPSKHIPIAAVLCVVPLATGCIVMKLSVTEPPVDRAGWTGGRVTLHLADGTTGFYPEGVQQRDGRFTGTGTRYDLTLRDCGDAGPVPADSVVAITRSRLVVHGGKTALINGIYVASFGLLVAIFAATWTPITISAS